MLLLLLHSLTAEPSTPVSPNVTVTPDTLAKSLGEAAIFECTVSGHPSPIILWEKLHSPVFPHTAKVLRSGVLVIDPVVPEDAGVYRCLARNSEGETHGDVTLEVASNIYTI